MITLEKQFTRYEWSLFWCFIWDYSELGVPCVIGTKIATQVLKDGDEVEVDADHGVVRKLNS